jgi:hypothetical protein
VKRNHAPPRGVPTQAAPDPAPDSDGRPLPILDEEDLLSEPAEVISDDPRGAAIYHHLKNHLRRVAARRRGDADACKGLSVRVTALEGAHGWVRKALLAVAIAALGSLGAAVTKVWSSAEAVTTERIHLERAREDIKELRDELRAIQRRSYLPDRANAPVATLRTP